MSLFDHKQYEYFKLTRDYAGKIKGEVFKVALDQSQVQWYDKDGGGHVTLELSSPLLEKLPDLNISEFRYKDSEIFKRVKQTAKYKSGAKTVFTIDEIMENPDFVIHAVKNSIGLEFTVGERTSQGVIQSFQVQRHNEVHAMFNDGKNYADVNTLEKIYVTSDKVLIDWEAIKEESAMSIDEWKLFLKHNHDNMLMSMGIHDKSVVDCFDKFHYSFLKGPIHDFFDKFGFKLQTGVNQTMTHHNYAITLPDGQTKRNSGHDEFDLPTFPTQEHAHSAAVRSIFQHLHNALLKKSEQKLQNKS